MKVVTFHDGSRQGVGLLGSDGDVIHDLSGWLPKGATSALDVVERWSDIEANITGDDFRSLPLLAVSAVSLLAPFPVPRRNIFCVGKNYADHAVEFMRSGYDGTHSGDDSRRLPVFTKATTSVIGPRALIDPHDGVTAEVDYEAELAVIIGRGGRGISRGAAYEHIWGYTIVNDVTARDLQRDHQQWLLGKSLDTHCPMGPWAVTADEIEDVAELEVECRVNGELRQKAFVADLIVDIPALIEMISAGVSLVPGDIIATGTPAGVGAGFTPPQFLKPGDEVEASITGLGTLSNRVAEIWSHKVSD